MKKSVSMLIVILLVGSIVYAQNRDNPKNSSFLTTNGWDWVKLNQKEKEQYIKGLYAGIDIMAAFMYTIANNPNNVENKELLDELAYLFLSYSTDNSAMSNTPEQIRGTINSIDRMYANPDNWRDKLLHVYVMRNTGYWYNN